MAGYYQQNTPQSKIVSASNKFGNTNIKDQQSTTRVLFDTLPLDGRTQFRFFENCNTRTLPFTNLTSDGNRLQVGESLAIQEIYFQLLKIDANGAITQYWSFAGGGPINGAPLVTGDLDFIIANSTVIKELSALVCTGAFNPGGVNASDEAYSTQTDITLQPLLEFIGVLRTTSYTFNADFVTHIRMSIKGTSSILAPKTTF